jgi:Dolichyl-phosphate-mannose-protein mannosyltransferase
VVGLVAVLPRLVVLLVERGTILEDFVEKSDRFAQTFASSGTFGFIPGVPSANTQPLYAFFLGALYWPLERSWVVVGVAQIAIAVVTALLVVEIGRRLESIGVGVVAAIIATLHPYVVWHDVHVNREILDGLLVVLLTLLALLAHERRSVPIACAAGVVCGVAILGNTRLVLLPLVLAPYVMWRVRPGFDAVVGALLVVVFAAAVVAPWVIRNEANVGCVAITTDARALWKANNPRTYDVLANGGWIDDVPELPGAPPWPELAADLTLGGTPTTVDECDQMRFYQDEVFAFWRDEPGEKARLSAQAVRMLWSPTFTTDTAESAGGSFASKGREVVEPVFMILLYALALAGLFLAPAHFVALVLLLLGTNTAAAMVFAGTVRYRAPFDALLAVLASFALVRAWESLGRWRASGMPLRRSAER